MGLQVAAFPDESLLEERWADQINRARQADQSNAAIAVTTTPAHSPDA